MKLFGNIRSRAFRCYWTLSELELSIDTQDINFKNGDAKDPAFLAINPLAKIPALSTDEETLFESMAICLAIAEKDEDNKLIFEAGTYERALVYQWLSFTVSELEQPLWNIRKHMSIYPEKLRAPEILSSCRADFKRCYKALLSRLEGREFLVGDRFSLADIFVGQTLFWARQTLELEIDLSPTKTYTDGLKSRERFPRIK